MPTITVGSVGLDGEFIAAFGGEGSKPASLDGLTRRLTDLGAKVISAPVIRTEPVDGPPIDPSAFDLIVVTSPNTPPLLLERIGGEARARAGVEVGTGLGPIEIRSGVLLADGVPCRALVRRGARPPEGVPVLGGLALTVAVKVTVCPKTDPLVEELRLVLVLALPTVSAKVPALLAELASPP